MAYITDISIEGLAGRTVPYSPTLRPDINVFFGVNGSGKTSLLKILHSALSGDATILANVPFARAEVLVYSNNHSRLFSRTFDKSKPTTTIAQRPLRQPDGQVVYVSGETIQVWNTDPPNVLASKGWPHTYLPTSRLFGTQLPRYVGFTTSAPDDEALERQSDLQFAELMERLWARYFAEISQKVQRAQERGLASLLIQFLSGPRQQKLPLATTPEEFDTLFERVARFMARQRGEPSLGSRTDFRDRYDTDVQFQNVVDDLNSVEAQVEHAMEPRNKLQSLINRLFSNKRINLAEGRVGITMADDLTIPLSALSSGEKHMLRLLVETLTDHTNSTIIDEPELSLHIDWQQELLSDLCDLKPSSQLIVATHSPEIMAHVSDENIFRL